MKQASFSMTGYFDKGKRTKREQFLAEMDQAMPWTRLLALVEPHYPKGSPAGGRPRSASICARFGGYDLRPHRERISSAGSMASLSRGSKNLPRTHVPRAR